MHVLKIGGNELEAPGFLDTLAAAVGEDKGTLEDLVEPFLIKGGFLDRTPRGRMATRKGSGQRQRLQQSPGNQHLFSLPASIPKTRRQARNRPKRAGRNASLRS